MVESSELDGIFHALADPTRRSLIARLATGPHTVGQLAAPLPMSLAAVSKHLGVLGACGLVEKRRRGREVRCRLRPERLRLAADWVGDYAAFWNARLAALEAVVEEERARRSDGGDEREPEPGESR